MDAEINVYLDEYDDTLNDLAIQGNSKGTTERIQKGIIESTHMLCVISIHTKNSYWVPFEIGYAYDKEVEFLSDTLFFNIQTPAFFPNF